jgi:ribosomal protein L11 methylase PrmA
MLSSLERTIRKLELPGARTAHWGGYEGDNSYSVEQREKKQAAVRAFVQRRQPKLLLDIGCNAGEYSAVALEAGAGRVIGLERDTAAVHAAALRADTLDGKFLPLQMDIQNPTPAQGWALAERRSLADRVHPDALLCLALIHHLVLSEGIPLELVVPTLVSLAPSGIIEFVPPDDPMARRIRGPAERVIHRYDRPTFMSILSQTASVTNQILLAENGRVLVEYCRKT